MHHPQRILVTGAAGFVGRYLVNRLCAVWPQAKLCLVDRKPDNVQGQPVRPLDVSDEAQVKRLIKEFTPDAAVHLAAVSAISTALEDRRRTWEINAFAPYYLAMAIMDHAPGCHLLFVSSAEVYGKSAKFDMALTERHLLQPSNPYASAKAAADLLLQEAASSGLSTTIMRPFNHTGPGQTLAFAVPSFCSQIVRIERGAEPVIRVGALDDVRDFLHVSDVVDAYVAALQQRNECDGGVIFNVASGRATSMNYILNYLIDSSETKIAVEVDATKLRSRLPSSVVGDPAILKEKLGWQVTRSLEDTLDETLAYWRRHP